jgi:hypothetical protein
LIGAFVFAVLAYVTTISNTIKLYKDNTSMVAKIGKAENAPKGIAEMRKSLEGLNDKLNHYLIDTTKDQEHTLEIVSEFCTKKNLIVKELPQRKITSEKDFTIITSTLKTEGNYINLLQLLYELEHFQKLGRVSSVSWKSSIDTKTKRTILIMSIYLQNIMVNNENNKKNEKNS